MRTLAAGLLIVTVCALPADAQERDPSLDRIRLALDQPSIFLGGSWIPDEPPPTRIGPFTFVPPQFRGEMVRVSVPIGAIVMKAFRGVAHANYRRKEAAARRRVAEDLRLFAEQRRQ